MGHLKNAWARFKATKFYRSCRAVWGIKFLLMPKWMIPVFVVCLAIPGPLDEFLALIVVAVRVLCKPELRRILVTAVKQA